jgi:hypothetical protein
VREKVKIGKDDREKQGERRETERESGLRNNLDFCGCMDVDVAAFGGRQTFSLCFTFYNQTSTNWHDILSGEYHISN